MAAFVDPRATETVTVDGVDFIVRGLPGLDAAPMVAWEGRKANGADPAEMQALSLVHAARCGLVGWSADTPAFDADDMDANLALLSSEALTAVASAVIALTFVTPEQAGN